MNIREKINTDYKHAVTVNSNIMKYALSELMIEMNKVYHDDHIFDKMERMVEERGKKVIRGIIKNKVSVIETDVYVMNLYNQYLSTHKYNMTRRIVLKTNDEEVLSEESWNTTHEAEPKIITLNKSSFRDKLKGLFSL